jgi:hypothetical protein
MGISGEALGFLHGGDGRGVRGVECHIERKATDTEGLPQKDVDGRREIHAEFAVKRLALFLDVAVQADAEIGCIGVSH